jgi:hypothetical protein
MTAPATFQADNKDPQKVRWCGQTVSPNVAGGFSRLGHEGGGGGPHAEGRITLLAEFVKVLGIFL